MNAYLPSAPVVSCREIKLRDPKVTTTLAKPVSATLTRPEISPAPRYLPQKRTISVPPTSNSAEAEVLTNPTFAVSNPEISTEYRPARRPVNENRPSGGPVVVSDSELPDSRAVMPLGASSSISTVP